MDKKGGLYFAIALLSLLVCSSFCAAPNLDRDQAIEFTFSELDEMCHYFFEDSGVITMELMTTTIKKEELIGRKFPEPNSNNNISYDRISISTDIFEPFEYSLIKKRIMEEHNEDIGEHRFDSYNRKESIATMKVLLMNIQYLKPKSLHLDLAIPTPYDQQLIIDCLFEECDPNVSIQNSLRLDIDHLVFYINSNLFVTYLPGLEMLFRIFLFDRIKCLDIHASLNEQNWAYLIISNLKATSIDRAKINMYNPNKNINRMSQISIPNGPLRCSKQIKEISINLDTIVRCLITERPRRIPPDTFKVPDWICELPSDLLHLPVTYYDRLTDEQKNLIRVPKLIISVYTYIDQQKWSERVLKNRAVSKDRPARTLEVSLARKIFNRDNLEDIQSDTQNTADLIVFPEENEPTNLNDTVNNTNGNNDIHGVQNRNYLNKVEDMILWTTIHHPEVTDLVLSSSYNPKLRNEPNTKTTPQKKHLMIILNEHSHSNLKTLTVDGEEYEVMILNDLVRCIFIKKIEQAILPIASTSQINRADEVDRTSRVQGVESDEVDTFSVHSIESDEVNIMSSVQSIESDEMDTVSFQNANPQPVSTTTNGHDANPQLIATTTNGHDANPQPVATATNGYNYKPRFLAITNN